MLFGFSLLFLWYEGAGTMSEPLSIPGKNHRKMICKTFIVGVFLVPVPFLLITFS
jgi:hypothetical protein